MSNRKLWSFFLPIVFGCLMSSIFVCQVSAQESDTRVLTLTEAYRKALRNNNQVKASRENVKTASEDVRIARSELLPRIRINAEWFRQKEITQFASNFPDEEFNYGATLSQPLFQGGESWFGFEAAEDQQKASKLNHFRRKQQILFTVADRYYGVLLARRQIEIEQNALKRARRQLQQAKARREVGQVTKSAVLRNEVQVSQSREQLRRAENRYDVALERLALELGMDDAYDTVVDPPKHTAPDTTVDYLYLDALQHRRDFKSSIRTVSAQRDRTKVAEADWYPNISLETSYDRFPQNEVFHGAREDWQLAFVGSYPIFSGFQDDAEIERAQSQLKQAKANLSRLKREIRVDVRTAYLDIKTQQEVIDRLKSQVTSARENYRQFSAQFEEGLVSSVDVIDAFTALREAENQLAIAQFTYQLQILQLRVATGTFRDALISRTMKSFEPKLR